MSEYTRTSKSDLSTSISISESFNANYPYINENLIKKICILLETLINFNQNKNRDMKTKKMSIFDLNGNPSISLYDYLYRIVKYTKIKDNTLITALIYIDIISAKNKFVITHYNIYKILFIAIILASKHSEDNFLTNKLYSEIGGIQVKELELLEKKFSIIIRFKFSLEKILFEKYSKYINNDYIFFNAAGGLNTR